VRIIIEPYPRENSLMKIGYARVSTQDQKASIDHQVKTLKEAGCEKVYKEEVSAVALESRIELDKALDGLRPGDALICTTLSRLARSTAHLLSLVEEIENKGAAIQILDMNLDTCTSTGKLILSVIGAINQFERELMLERQKVGIARAKAEGKYKGRKPTAKAKSEEVLALAARDLTKAQIKQLTGVSIPSIYRILAEHRQANS
jgi:DNA invertase Pin-like site-specific DNA recombinase